MHHSTDKGHLCIKHGLVYRRKIIRPVLDRIFHPKMIVECLSFLALFGLVRANLDPEVTMSVPEIINRWGYPVEEMEVITEDNYILTMHRIPYGKDGKIRLFL
jgi:hypothetical protein